MAWSIPILVACSTFGAANGGAFSGGRFGNIDIISYMFIGIFSLKLEERFLIFEVPLIFCEIKFCQESGDSYFSKISQVLVVN